MASAEPKIKVVAFDTDIYGKKLVDIAELASKKYKRVVYLSFGSKKKEIESSWKNKNVFPERFRIFDLDGLGATEKNILTQLDEFVKSNTELDFADLIIFDSISLFTGPESVDSIKSILTTMMMRILKKRISCLLPILKEDINSEPINEISKVIDGIIEWENPDINDLVKELRNLSETLLGPMSSKILIGAAEGETPVVLLDQFEQEMGTILGPGNVRTQVEDLRERFAGEFI